MGSLGAMPLGKAGGRACMVAARPAAPPLPELGGR